LHPGDVPILSMPWQACQYAMLEPDVPEGSA
jgi:hypothetical protein